MNRTHFLIAVILLHAAILTGLLVKTVYPLITGTEIKMRVRPVDPRDLMRGQYVALSYDYTRLELDKLKTDLAGINELHFGDELYLVLKKNEKGLYEPAALHINKPVTEAAEKLLKVIVQSDYYLQSSRVIWLKAGIESFFAAPETALDIEQGLREHEYAAVVAVTEGGVARLKDVIRLPAGLSENLHQ